MSNTNLLDRPGGQIAYDDAGGDGTLVIAAPGMGDTRGVYRHLTPLLGQAGLRVATFDLRGIGESSASWDDLSDAAVASDYLAVIDALDSGPVILIGSSLSCASAVIAATEAPEKVAGLVIIGPFVRDVPQKWWLKAAFAALLMPPWGRSAWVSYYRTKLYPGPKPADHDDYVSALASNLAEPGRFASFRTIAPNSHAESGRRLAQVTQPVLVVMGTADPDYPDPVAEAHHLGEIFNTTPLLVEGSGHYPQADNPQSIAPGIIDFVRKTVD